MKADYESHSHSPDREREGAQFELTPLPAQDRFAIWSFLVKPLFVVALGDATPSEAFDAAVGIRFLGDDLIARTDSKAQSFRRDSQVREEGGWDHIAIQHYFHGSFHGDVDGRPIDVREGDVVVLDLLGGFRTEATDFGNRTLLLRRSSAGPLAARRFHGQVLRREHPLIALTTRYLAFLETQPESLTDDEVDGAVAALVTMLAASLEAGEARPFDSNEAVVFATLRTMLELAPATEPRLASLAGCAGLDVTLVSRIIGGDAGLASRVDGLRAEMARQMLLRSDDRQSMAQIATRSGFASVTQMNRALQATFGQSGSDIGKNRLRTSRRRPSDSRLRDWVLTTTNAFQPGTNDSAAIDN